MKFVAMVDINGDEILINPTEVDSLESLKIMDDGEVISRTVMTMKSGRVFLFNGWPSFIAGKMKVDVLR
jgi:hypothetical protein